MGGTLRRVKKTSLYLPEEIDRALARRAESEGMTKAALIRRALEREAGEEPRVRAIGAGAFSGPAELSTRTDEHLADADFGR